MLLEKVKHNGKVKLRVILICPQSAEFAVSSNAERVQLERPLDEMFDMLELMAASEQRPETDAGYFCDRIHSSASGKLRAAKTCSASASTWAAQSLLCTGRKLEGTAQLAKSSRCDWRQASHLGHSAPW